jgi:hypothetical protein
MNNVEQIYNQDNLVEDIYDYPRRLNVLRKKEIKSYPGTKIYNLPNVCGHPVSSYGFVCTHISSLIKGNGTLI